MNDFISFDVLVVVSPGSETKSLSATNKSPDDLHLAATDVGMLLRQVSEKYDKELIEEFDHRLGDNIDYNTFRTLCSNVLRSTVDRVTSCGNQILLVFASYMRLSRVQNVHQEISGYVGQYFSDMGFQPWIQRQGGWVSCNIHNCV